MGDLASRSKSGLCTYLEVVIMDNPTDEQIRARAHELWEKAGKPEGRQDDFWHAAEQELRNEDPSSPLRTPDTL